MTYRLWLKIAASLLLMAAPAVALAQNCAAPDPTVWTAAAAACANAPADQTCLGAGHATAAPRSSAPQFSLAAPGDLAESGALKSLDLDANSAALIHTPANLKDGQATIALFGDVQLADAVKGKYVPAKPVITGDTTFTIQAKTWIQGTVLNKTPSLIPTNPVATLDKDVTVTINARTGDTAQDPVRVLTADGITGWTGPGLFKLPDGKSVDQSPDFLKLPLIDAQSAAGRNYTPFQRMTFQGAPCPGNGMLIHVPKGNKPVWFQINKNLFLLQSTLYIYDTPDGSTVYATLEGTVTIYLDHQAIAIPEGSEVVVSPDGTVGPLQPYDPTIVQFAPVELLPDNVIAAPPLSAAELNAWANPSADPVQGGSWTIDLFYWETRGTCPYPPGLVSSIGEITVDFEWSGNVDELIQYWKSGQAQEVASQSGIEFTFTQEGSDYVFTYTGASTSEKVVFRRVSPRSFAVFSTFSSGTDCVLAGSGVLYYSPIE